MTVVSHKMTSFALCLGKCKPLLLVMATHLLLDISSAAKDSIIINKPINELKRMHKIIHMRNFHDNIEPYASQYHSTISSTQDKLKSNSNSKRHEPFELNWPHWTFNEKFNENRMQHFPIHSFDKTKLNSERNSNRTLMLQLPLHNIYEQGLTEIKTTLRPKQGNNNLSMQVDTLTSTFMRRPSDIIKLENNQTNPIIYTKPLHNDYKINPAKIKNEINTPYNYYMNHFTGWKNNLIHPNKEKSSLEISPLHRSALKLGKPQMTFCDKIADSSNNGHQHGFSTSRNDNIYSKHHSFNHNKPFDTINKSDVENNRKIQAWNEASLQQEGNPMISGKSSKERITSGNFDQSNVSYVFHIFTAYINNEYFFMLYFLNCLLVFKKFLINSFNDDVCIVKPS